MGLTNRKGAVGSAVSLEQTPSPIDREKQAIVGAGSDGSGKGYRHDGADDHTHLHRGLKARQVTMIAIGGAMYAS